MIARCHARIFVGVVMYIIGAYHLLSTYYLSTYCYKRMRLLTRLYGMWPYLRKPAMLPMNAKVELVWNFVIENESHFFVDA